MADAQTVSSTQPRWSTPIRLALYLIACAVSSALGLGLGLGVHVLPHLNKDNLLHEVDPTAATLTAALGIYLGLIVLTWLFIKKVERRRLSDFGFSRSRMIPELLRGAAIAAAFIVIVKAIYLAAGWVRLNPTDLSATFVRWLLVSLLLYPLIGVAEEMVFRGYLLQVLDAWKGPWVALIGSSLLFWLSHLGVGNMHTAMGFTAMMATATVFALCRYATGSLWCSIGLHVVWDWLLVSSVGYPEAGLPSLFDAEILVPHWLIGPPGVVGLADLSATLLLLAAILYVWFRNTPLKPLT